MSRSSVRSGVLATLTESVLVLGAVVASAYARFGFDVHVGALFIFRVVVLALVWQFCLYYAELYDRRTMLDRQMTIIRIGQATGAASLALSVLYYWFPDLMIGRGIMLIALFVLPVLAFAQRLAVDWSVRRHGKRERLLIVGTSEDSIRLSRELHGLRHELALEIVGFVDRDPTRVGTPLFNPAIVGAIGQLGAAISSRSADRVAISGTSTLEEMSLDELLRLRFAGVTFDHLASVYEECTGKLAIEALTPIALMSSAGFKRHSLLLALKRTTDVIVATIGLILAAPLMLVAAVLIKATSEGSVFYNQKRAGENGRIFTIHKLRSMYSDAEQESGPVWARDNDERVTRIGRLLRRTRFDEVPQLWNVLRGEMSLVGPRPERPEIDLTLIDEIPLYAQRRLVKPGVTGWAQVRHSYAASVLDARVKLQYDLFYIKNISLALDFLILLMTTKTILRGSGAR